MPKLIDLTGKQFGRWTVLYFVGKNKHGVPMWHCRCSCGNERDVQSGQLTGGYSKSCGCHRTDNSVIANTKHGMSHSRLYNIWRCMKKRCYLPTSTRYSQYGGRGITVCDEWRDDFCSFMRWAKSNGYSENLTIDRIDVNGPYSPQNCRWVNSKMQATNKRNSHLYSWHGETHTLSEWAEITGINQKTIWWRIKNNKSPDNVFKKS